MTAKIESAEEFAAMMLASYRSNVPAEVERLALLIEARDEQIRAEALRITPEALAMRVKRMTTRVNDVMDKVAVALYTSAVTYEETKRAEIYLAAIRAEIERREIK